MNGALAWPPACPAAQGGTIPKISLTTTSLERFTAGGHTGMGTLAAVAAGPRSSLSVTNAGPSGQTHCGGSACIFHLPFSRDAAVKVAAFGCR